MGFMVARSGSSIFVGGDKGIRTGAKADRDVIRVRSEELRNGPENG